MALIGPWRPGAGLDTLPGSGSEPEMGRTQATGLLSQLGRCWLLLPLRPLLLSATASTTATESVAAASAGPIAQADGGDAVRGLLLCLLLRPNGRQVLDGGVDRHFVGTDGQTAEAIGVVE